MIRAWVAALSLLVGCASPTADAPAVLDDDDTTAPVLSVAPARFDPVDLAPGDDDDDDDAQDDDDDTPAGACPDPSGPPPDSWFADVTACAGLIASSTANDIYVTGQAWGDVDGDGLLDLYVTGFDDPSRLFLNRGDGTFSEDTPSPLALPDGGTQGAVFVDYDNDGDPDLHVVCRGRDRLLRNNGDGSWHDLSVASNLDQTAEAPMAAWADYDGDGWLDVYVTTYLGGGVDLAIDGRDRLYRNLGDGSFADVSALLGSDLLYGPGLAVAWFDFDDDGDPDLYVANDKGNAQAWLPGDLVNRNLLFRNDGPGCGGWCFEEIGEAVGADLRADSMGVEVADYDGDGWLDLAVSDEGPPHLLRNLGGTFVETTLAVGWDAADTVVGWGPALLDHDNDGDGDLALSDGRGPMPNWFLDQEEDGLFTDRSDDAGLSAGGADSAGIAIADYDRDGRQDLVIGNREGTYQLLRNLRPTPGHWLRVSLVGGGPVARDAVGTRLTLTDSDGTVRIRETSLGRSLGSAHDPAAWFGLGAATPASLAIRWRDGTETSLTTLPVDDTIVVQHPLAH